MSIFSLLVDCTFRNLTKKARQALLRYRKILKISPGAYIFQRSFLRGLVLEGLIYGGKFAFQNRLASLIVGSKFTVLALFHFAFEGKFPSTSP